MIWPQSEGLTKGEVYCWMAKERPQLSDEEKEELERRALYLLKLYGVQEHDSPQLWRKHSVVYQCYPLMIASDEYKLRVMFSQPPDARGIQTYQLAFEKTKGWDTSDAPPYRGRLALTHMRRLMLLDDLADV